MSPAASNGATDWPRVELGELCDVSIGRTPRRDRASYWGVGVPWLSIADMSQGRDIMTTKETITELAFQDCKCRMVSPGTVLLSFKLSIGKVGVARRAVCTNEAIAALPIRDAKRLCSEYLYWVLKSIDLSIGQDRAAMGLTLNKAKLLAIGIPTPPLLVQRRIARILDAAEGVRAKRRTALAQLDTLTLAVFRDLFGDPATNPKAWPVAAVRDVAEQVTDGEHLTPKRTSEGIKLLSARNIRNGFIDFGNVDFIGTAEHERIRRRCSPSRGDVLISCSGTIGRVACVETDEPFSLVRSVALVRPLGSKVATRFLAEYLRTPSLRSRMLRDANASSQANLFQAQIRGLPVLVPPLLLQQDFARRAAAVDKLRVVHSTSLAEMDSLFASLQHRAFRGEL